MYFSVIKTEKIITSGRWEHRPTYTLPDEDDKVESTTTKAPLDMEKKQISSEIGTVREREMFFPTSCVGCVIPSWRLLMRSLRPAIIWPLHFSPTQLHAHQVVEMCETRVSHFCLSTGCQKRVKGRLNYAELMFARWWLHQHSWNFHWNWNCFENFTGIVTDLVL
jgi:hypothetical protein